MIFLAYSHHDVDLANRIVKRLEEKGIKIWFAHKDIITGDFIVKKVQDGLSKSNFIAVLLTQHSVQSGWVEREWQTTIFEQLRGSDKIILPLITDEECEIPLFLRPYHKADFRRGIDRGIEMLLKHIQQHSKKENDITPATYIGGTKEVETLTQPLEEMKSEIQDIRNSAQDHLKTQFILQIFEKTFFIQDAKKYLKKLAERIKADCVRVFFQIRPRLIVGLTEAEYNPLPLKPALFLPPNNGFVGWAISKKRPVYFPCNENEKWAPHYCESDDRVAAELVVPITINKTSIGAILADWTANAFKDSKPWSFINITLKDAKKWCERTAQILTNDIIQIGQNKDSIYHKVIQDCVKITGSHRGYIALWAEHGSLNYTRYGTQIDNFLELSPTEGVCGKVLKTCKPLIIDQLPLHPDAVISDPGMLSELIVPITKGNITVGIINVEARQKSNYDREDLEYLESQAKIISKKVDSQIIDILTTSNTVLLSADNLNEMEIIERLKHCVSYILPEGSGVIVRKPTPNEQLTPWGFPNENNLIYPIKIKGKCYRVLEIISGFDLPLFLTPEHRDRIKLLTEIAANSIRRRWNLERQHVFAEMLSDLSQSPNIKHPAGFFRDILKRIRYLLDCSHCTLFWLSPKNSSRLIPAISTKEELFLKNSEVDAYEEGVGLTGYVFKTKKLICISDLNDSEYIETTFGPDVKWKCLINETKSLIEKARSFMAAPLFSQKNKRFFGVLRVYIESKEIKPSFTVEDQHMLRSITTALAPWIEKALSEGLHPQVRLICGSHAVVKEEKCPPQLLGYTFSAKRANKAGKENRLLSLRLETSLICNSRCVYCCNDSGKKAKGEISFEKRKEILKEAHLLGAESIVFIGGGEFLCYDRYPELLRVTYEELKMIPVVFTNGIAVDREAAELLKKTNSTVIVKLDSLDKQIQNKMAGLDGAFDSIMSAFENLKRAGYQNNSEDKKLKIGASAVVTAWNILGIQDFWRFCRDNGFFPNIELLIPNGRARGREDLMPKKEDIHELKLKLLDIDRQLGYEWIPYTPRIGSGCLQLLYSLYITYDGYIRPCASLHYQTLNVRDVTLKEAMSREPYKTARNIHNHLQGKCKKCIYSYYCYGCRGLSYTEMKLKGASDYDALCHEDTSCHLKNGF